MTGPLTPNWPPIYWHLAEAAAHAGTAARSLGLAEGSFVGGPRERAAARPHYEAGVEALRVAALHCGYALVPLPDLEPASAFLDAVDERARPSAAA